MVGDTEVKTLSRIRRVYKDTKANLDALTGLADEDLAYGTDTLALYRQNGAGAANWEVISSLFTTSGTYTGNDAVNRAIPHGLGILPKIVFLWGGVTPNCAFIYGGYAFIRHVENPHTNQAVTAPDVTNFYVGNASSPKMNDNTGVYIWVAVA